MKEMQFFKTVLDIVPLGTICEIMTSDDELKSLLIKMDNVDIEEDYAYSFLLTSSNKFILTQDPLSQNVIEYIHRIYIKNENKLLFVAYDGFGSNIISAQLELTSDFVENFVKTGICIIKDTILA